MCLLTDYGCCRGKAKGATFFEATEGETVRPMLDVSWAPMLGAFSVLFEEFSAGEDTDPTTATMLALLYSCTNLLCSGRQSRSLAN